MYIPTTLYVVYKSIYLFVYEPIGAMEFQKALGSTLVRMGGSMVKKSTSRKESSIYKIIISSDLIKALE